MTGKGMGEMPDDIFVTRSTLPPLEEYLREITPLWDSHWITNMGEKHNLLQAELERVLKVQYLSLFTNGHMALELCLQAMELEGEVITTPFTFISTIHAIVRSGLTPVFCDIEPERYTIDADQIEQLITENTTAIVPVHVYGNLCDVDAIEKLAKKYSLTVIYDAAHAFGVERDGVGAGAFGDASMFSFHATKVFHTIEGGAVAHRDATLDDKLYKIKNFGICNEVEIDRVGANAKMNEFSAAMGLCNLRHFEEEIGKRRQVHDRYIERLTGVKGVTLPKWQPGVKPNYAYFPVLFDEALFGANREDVYKALMAIGVHTRRYFYPLANSLDCIGGRFDAGNTPVAERVADRVLTLPLYAELSPADVDRVCDGLLALYRRR